MVAMERPSSLVPRKPRLPPLEATGEKPLFFFAVVALLNIVDAFNLNIVWPMLPFMVESFGVAKSEADLGAWVGAAGAAVSVGQLMSSYAWGALSDRIGRRPVLLMGMFNSTFSVLVFGTATTYTQCLVGRFLSGLLNGNAGVVKTYVGETTNKSQRTFAFSVFALAFGTASVLAPAIGGFLQQPASTWPAVFGSTVFETYPFLLPMLCAAFLTFTGGVLGFLYAPETASQWRRMEKRRLAKEATRVTGAGGVEIDDEEKKLLPAEVEMTERSERDGCVSVAQVVSHVDCEWIDPEGEDPSLGEKKLNRGDDAATRLKLWREISSSSRIDGTDRDLKTEALHTNGWNHDTATAASCYALLAFIAIGYDEILPVYAKTSQGMGGLGFNPAQIGTVLIVGGVFLIGFQLAVFPKLLKLLGVVNGLRVAALAFALVSLVAPIASVAGVVKHATLKWFVLLLSQIAKIATLAVLFTTVIMAVNNSCLNKVKARVNGAATTLAAAARIASPIAHGVVYSASLKLRQSQYPYRQFFVFLFVSASSVVLFLVASRLPKKLDQPPEENENEPTAGRGMGPPNDGESHSR